MNMDKLPVIKVFGSAMLKVAPDYNRIIIKVNHTFADNDEAYEVAKKNNLFILAALDEAGLDGSLLKTKCFDISENSKPVYEKGRWMGYQKNGYILEQQLYIDLPIENKRLNKINKAIAENVPYVEIELKTFLSNPHEHRMKALSLAVLDAKEKAGVMAATLGCTLGQILEINYNAENDDYEVSDSCLSLPSGPSCDSGAALELTGEEESISESVRINWQLINP